VSLESILAELDGDQKRAATAASNAVIAAGAGSGKTKVLASRYAWLVMERGYRVEEILTLTFTNKAVNEMYSRIYGLLAGQGDNERARRAIQDFHRANIGTIDSFCTGVARIAARRYGIAADFRSDNDGVRELALETALPFVLDHREDPALQVLMADKKIKTVAEDLFADTMLNHSPISSPLDLRVFMEIQAKELNRQWKAQTERTALLLNQIMEELDRVSGTKTKLYEALRNLTASPPPAAPDLEGLLESGGFSVPGKADPTAAAAVRPSFAGYFEWLFNIKSISLSGNHSGEYRIIKENLGELKNSLYGELESIANIALGGDIIAGVFPLVEEFQSLFNRKKREAGMLSFNDIARLAVDALTSYPDIRRVYKDTIKSIMVDEFQDNNSLQRDLIFLLAEDAGRGDPGLPRTEDLCPGKMFFVGDEKQSIYRFRGADVSVFRGLARGLAEGPGGEYLNLRFNYRSKPALIAAFNRIFGGVPEDAGAGVPGDAGTAGVFLRDQGDTPDYEALYHPVYPPSSVGGDEGDMPAKSKTAVSKAGTPEPPPVFFCFLDEGQLDRKDPRGLSSADLEAAFIARRIRQMVDSGYAVQTRHNGESGSRPCVYQDFAVLQRSYSYQRALEKQFKEFDIPFTADRPAGLFNDAPINDLYQLLRLLAYPADRIAYAALLRSPFARLSDVTLTLCLLDESGVPFNEALDGEIPPEERELYRQSRERYLSLAEAARTIPVTELITKLWYDEGYRYETIWTPSARIYGELYDLFFEIARKAEERGKGLADFLDYLGDVISREEKLDEPDIPSNGEAGVRLMSIHKSKGLEFPVVFIYRCAGGGSGDRNTKSIYFSEPWGFTLNLPQAEELPGGSGNYFFNRRRDEETRKAAAELRRLLYVAMTRAESALFVTAALPRQTKEEKKEGDLSGEALTEDLIRRRLIQLAAKKQGGGTGTFLDLLLPVLAGADDFPFPIEAIPVYTRSELRSLASQRGRSEKAAGVGASAGIAAGAATGAAMREAAEYAAGFYDAAKLLSSPPPAPSRLLASGLHYAPGKDATGEHRTGLPPDPMDLIIEKAGLDGAGFGVLVHAFLEARFSGQKPRIPPRILAGQDEKTSALVSQAARDMAQGFVDSALGRLAMDASYRASEFPIITAIDRGPAGGVVHVSGRIDLLFESAGTLYVIDFKTDRIEEPRRHWAQLAVYERAVKDIFQKPVRAYLFYLRGGHPVDLSGSLEEADLEALVGEGRNLP
jgi:ATP-dependent helicase/nuclease subunit A